MIFRNIYDIISMITLHIENNYSRLITDDLLLREELWNEMRFRDKNYFHSRLYKMKLWSGHVDFFKKDTGKFLTGLLPEVQFKLKQKNVLYQINDTRQGIEFVDKKIDENYLGNGYKLRDYQIEYIEKIAKYKRGIIDSKTSSGKTLTMVGMVKNLPVDTPTLILCNRKSLVEQNYNELLKFGIKNVGRVYDKHKEPNVITCSTIQSADYIEKLFPKIIALFCDESHLLTTTKTRRLYAKLKNCSIRVGMSATPFKFGGTDLCQKFSIKGWLGPIIKLSESSENGMLSVKELQDRNILSTAECIFIKIKEPILKHKIYLDAVTEGIAQNEHLHQIVKNLATSLPGRKLILVDRIEHGDRLKQLMPNAHWIQGKDDMESRQYVINQLSNSDNTIGIAMSSILSVGLNFYIHHLISCSDSKAEHVILQAFGRGLRVKEDKSHLKYYDFLYEINSYLNQHSKDRIKILKKHGHSVSIVDDISQIDSL